MLVLNKQCVSLLHEQDRYHWLQPSASSSCRSLPEKPRPCAKPPSHAAPPAPSLVRCVCPAVHSPVSLTRHNSRLATALLNPSAEIKKLERGLWRQGTKIKQLVNKTVSGYGFLLFLPSVAQNSRGSGTNGRKGELPRWVHQAGLCQRQAASGKVQEGDFGRGRTR